MPKIISVSEKRQQFVDAGLDIISNQGMAEATLRKVAAKLNCTTGALTHYFSSREALLVAALRNVHMQAAERMKLVASKDLSAHDRLSAVLLESIPLDRQRLNEWRAWLAFWSEASTNAKLAEENRKRYLEWEEVLDLLLKDLIPGQRERQCEVRGLRTQVDGIGLAILMKGTNVKKLREEQRKAREQIDSYMGKFVL